MQSKFKKWFVCLVGETQFATQNLNHAKHTNISILFFWYRYIGWYTCAIVCCLDHVSIKNRSNTCNRSSRCICKRKSSSAWRTRGQHAPISCDQQCLPRTILMVGQRFGRMHHASPIGFKNDQDWRLSFKQSWHCWFCKHGVWLSFRIHCINYWALENKRRESNRWSVWTTFKILIGILNFTVDKCFIRRRKKEWVEKKNACWNCVMPR